MIIETTRQALQSLFTETAPAVEGDAGAPRGNGVITRDYKAHGYHLDAQVAPDQLLAAVTIIDQPVFLLKVSPVLTGLRKSRWRSFTTFPVLILTPAVSSSAPEFLAINP